MPEMSIPARSNMPPFEPKSFCISTTITAVFAVSNVIASGFASRLMTRPPLSSGLPLPPSRPRCLEQHLSCPARRTSDCVLFRYHARLGVIRTFMGRKGLVMFIRRTICPEANSNVKRERGISVARSKTELWLPAAFPPSFFHLP